MPATINYSISSDTSHNLIRVYAYYRTLLGALLLFMQSNQFAPNILGNSDPETFHCAAMAYTILNVISLGILWRVNFSASQKQRFALFVIDIIAISALVYASKEASTGLSYLLIICIAAGSMMLRGQIALALAAFATITIILLNLIKPAELDSRALFAAGSLGGLLFITAICFLYLTRKIQLSTEEAQQQAKEAAHSQMLAQSIVERMRTGIMVLDNSNKIEMMNKSAEQLLNFSIDQPYQVLPSIPELEQQLEIWRAYNHTKSPIFTPPGSSTKVKISFARLEASADSDTLIFIEDSRAISQKAQQLKLASLGRLTASIAHEVRNPLGAISHASQLLAENDQFDKADKRLTDIIGHHSQRVNQIIENVLQLSSRKASQPESLELNDWLKTFIAEYQESTRREITIEFSPSDVRLVAKFDHCQLRQILTNLVDNALRHGFSHIGAYKIQLKTGIYKSSDAPYLQILDYGEGITKEHQAHIFEPFFTTEKTGSGLGLFISKELCEANQASLSYHHRKDDMSCFELQFAHPQRTL